MAKIWSNVSFNQNNFNLNTIKIGGSDYKFFDNLNTTIKDVTYQDIYTVEYTDNGNLLGVDVAGSAITVSANEKALTGGLVNGFFQVVSDGVDWYDAFGFEGIAVSAVALQKAIDSQSTTDDYKIIAGILSGNDTFNLSSYDDYALGYGGKDKLYTPDHLMLIASCPSGAKRMLKLDHSLFSIILKVGEGLPRHLVPESHIHRVDAFLERIGANLEASSQNEFRVFNAEDGLVTKLTLASDLSCYDSTILL